ncbi:hypothetical protein V6N12_031996 [Hibiscus sabdariffa]|uniref:Uncharacterized protein n=1 Tax=Hibiscus sabdariffa TaxID=183260 RepID=A0ABR2BYZ7_9ROSI
MFLSPSSRPIWQPTPNGWITLNPDASVAYSGHSFAGGVFRAIRQFSSYQALLMTSLTIAFASTWFALSLRSLLALGAQTAFGYPIHVTLWPMLYRVYLPLAHRIARSFMLPRYPLHRQLMMILLVCKQQWLGVHDYR